METRARENTRLVDILVMGASGSGTTTLGRALSARLGVAFFDGDDYFWLSTDPPYQEQRSVADRFRLLLGDLRESCSSVVSGCVANWGSNLEDRFSLIVFLSLDAAIRVARLRERERLRFGRVDEEFIEWAAQYEEGRLPGRSRARHEKWLAGRSCPILRLDGDMTVEERVGHVVEALSDQGREAP